LTLRKRLFFPINPFAAFVAFLGLDRERGDRAGFQALERDRLAGFLAIAVGAVFDALQRGVDLGNELTLPVAGAQFDRPVGLRGRPVGEVGMILVVVLEVLQRLLGLLEDILPPVEQLQPEVLALALVHERLTVRRPIDFVEGPDAFAVLA
jgi:hypothetical protein